MLTTPRVLLVAVLVGAVISLTAIDKYDESTCLDSRSSSPSLRNYAGPHSAGSQGCDGFLPW